jgi:hypothetical protein
MPEARITKRYVVINFQKEGIHCYPQAGVDPALADVSFLANPHRHMFHFNVKIEVFHNDRDLEFIQVKRWLESLYAEKILQLDYFSCEMMADQLIQQIWDKYCVSAARDIFITVSEDGENGALIVDYPAQPRNDVRHRLRPGEEDSLNG